MRRSTVLALSLAALTLPIAGTLTLQADRTASFSSSLGGPFELTAHTGRRFNSRELAGKPFALFFGFTHCPAICPTTLLEISNHLAALGTAAERLNVLFVTVDPVRDTVEHLNSYLGSFDPRIIGLTGTAEQIAATARAYRAIYEKVPSPSGYTMDHTAIVYLMDAAGRLTDTLSFHEAPEVQRAKFERLVAY